MINLSPVVAAARGTCRTGWGPTPRAGFAGGTPWGREHDMTSAARFDARDVSSGDLGGSHGREWADHHLSPRFETPGGQNQWDQRPAAGARTVCVTGTEEYSFDEYLYGRPPGYCIPGDLWSDKLIAQQEGYGSLLWYQERRVRELLQRLATAPFYGFANAVDAAAYDASFCLPTAPVYGLAAAVPRALSEYNSLFPAARWSFHNGFKTIECAAQTCNIGRYSDGGHAVALAETIGDRGDRAQCALNFTRIARAFSPGVTIPPDGEPPQSAAAAFIPWFEVFELRAGAPRALAPTAWFNGLLSCLAPGWHSRRLPTAPPKKQREPAPQNRSVARLIDVVSAIPSRRN
jgi:hypothetical protein